MRGTHTDERQQIANCRFIPAHAGNTLRWNSSWDCAPVHPRACGEHASRRSRSASPNGSSPRMRGTRNFSLNGCRSPRFIPAHAGNTPLRIAAERFQSVHPRACGEHDAAAALARGMVRFIPAHAGNTRRRHGHPRRNAVHPRACGEHFDHCETNQVDYGSSPRMRGTLQPERSAHSSTRFIPAHAGNTHEASGHSVAYAGSSPRMRGTRYRPAGGTESRRFIPAHAGNTRCCPPSPAMRPVHPRACGEHLRMAKIDVKSSGSSPRMRGTLYAR